MPSRRHIVRYNHNDLQNIAGGAANDYLHLSTAHLATLDAKIGGSGTIGKLSKFTASGTIGDSILTESASTLSSSGALKVGTTTGAFKTGTSIYTSLVLDGGANGALYAIGRASPLNSPFTGLSGYDNAGSSQRELYFGGGGWGVPDAQFHYFYCAPNYFEVADTGVLTFTIGPTIITSTVPIQAAAGSAAAPSYEFGGAGGTTMGMYQIGSGIIGCSTAGIERLRLSTAVFKSSLPIQLPGYTVATLPAGVQGMTAYVTDALGPTFLVAVVGGGTVVTPVFYNGAAWVTG